MNRKLLTILLVLVSQANIAQAKDPDNQRRYFPVASAQYWRFPSRVSLDEGISIGGSGNLRLVGAFGTSIEKLNTFLFGGLRYDWTEVLFKNQGTNDHVHFHGLFLRTAGSVKITDQWRFNCFVSLGLASDFQGIEGEDLLVTVGASALYIISPQFRLQFGATYSSAFFRPLVLPLFAIDYHSGPWHLSFQSLKGGAGWYEIVKDFEIGIHLRIVNLRCQSYSKAVAFDEITLLNIPAGLSFRKFFKHRFYALIEGGYNFQYSRMEINQATHSKFTFDGYQLSIGLGFMI
jgi:hypothetical protein